MTPESHDASMKHIEPLLNQIAKPTCGTCNDRKWVYGLSTEDVQVDCPTCCKSPTAAQERPKTALGEAADWIETQAEQLKESYPRKFEGSVCEVKYFQLLRYAKACREADEQ